MSQHVRNGQTAKNRNTKRRPRKTTRPRPIPSIGLSELMRLPTDAAARYICAALPELMRSGERSSILAVATVIHCTLSDQAAARSVSIETQIVLSGQTGR